MRRTFVFVSILMASLFAAAQPSAPAQPAVVRPGENLVVENIPPIPLAIAEKANQYGEFRAAGLLDWNPVKREMLIGTRGENLLRVKGILNLVGQDRPVAIHGVHHVFHPPVALPALPDADRRSRIGRRESRDCPC